MDLDQTGKRNKHKDKTKNQAIFFEGFALDEAKCPSCQQS